MLLLLVVVPVAAFSSLTGDTTWVLEKEKNEIKIYTRQSENINIKEFKAITTVKATVSQLIALISDVEKYPQWVDNIISSEVLKEVNSDEKYYYNEIKVPWPFANRDNIVLAKVCKSSDTDVVIIEMEGEPDYIPVKSGIVRIPEAKGYWKLTPIGNGETKVILRYLADPAGNIPVWLINMFIIDGPYNTLKNMKEFVKKEKYRG